MIIAVPTFSKSSVFKMLSESGSHEKPAFSNLSGSTSVLQKLRFRDGLVWTVGLYRNEAAFSNSTNVV